MGTLLDFRFLSDNNLLKTKFNLRFVHIFRRTIQNCRWHDPPRGGLGGAQPPKVSTPFLTGSDDDDDDDEVMIKKSA